MDYQKRMEQQIVQYSNNALRFFPPPAHKHWMQTCVNNKIQEVYGVKDHIGLYLSAVPQDTNCPEVLSVGSGDGQLEVKLVQGLIARGQSEVTMHVTEVSDIRLRRIQDRVRAEQLEDCFQFHLLDLNLDFPAGRFDMIFAHHVLHHIVELEFLFDSILGALLPNGCFATIDMIGRNGHQRWPECLAYIEMVWEIIPDHWKHNFQFNAFHESYLDHDCSGSGFEGIRAQDILPLLLKRFHFTKFVAGGGFMDILFDRGYGQSIDMENPKERALVDFISKMNEMLLAAGEIKPTMMFAHMKIPQGDASPVTKYWQNMSPNFAVRSTSG